MLFHSYFHLQTRPSHSNPSHTLPSHFCTFIIFLQLFSGRPHFIKISLHLAALYPFSSFLFTPVSFVSSPSFVTVPFWLSSSIFFFFFFLVFLFHLITVFASHSSSSLLLLSSFSPLPPSSSRQATRLLQRFMTSYKPLRYIRALYPLTFCSYSSSLLPFPNPFYSHPLIPNSSYSYHPHFTPTSPPP